MDIRVKKVHVVQHGLGAHEVCGALSTVQCAPQSACYWSQSAQRLLLHSVSDRRLEAAQPSASRVPQLICTTFELLLKLPFAPPTCFSAVARSNKDKMGGMSDSFMDEKVESLLQ